jgi:hypothetical protein
MVEEIRIVMWRERFDFACCARYAQCERSKKFALAWIAIRFASATTFRHSGKEAWPASI